MVVLPTEFNERRHGLADAHAAPRCIAVRIQQVRVVLPQGSYPHRDDCVAEHLEASLDDANLCWDSVDVRASTVAPGDEAFVFVNEREVPADPLVRLAAPGGEVERTACECGGPRAVARWPPRQRDLDPRDAKHTGR